MVLTFVSANRIGHFTEVNIRFSVWKEAQKEAEELKRKAQQEAEDQKRKAEQEGDRQHAKQSVDEQKAAEKQEKLARLRARFEEKVPTIGDHEMGIGKFIKTGISLESLRKKVMELEDELKELESMKDELVAEEGVE